MLEDKGAPIVDNDEGNVYHHILARDGETFIYVYEDKFLPSDLIKDYSDDVRPIMLFSIVFENDLRNVRKKGYAKDRRNSRKFI